MNRLTDEAIPHLVPSAPGAREFPVISLSGVSKAFGGRQVIKDVSLKIFPGDVVVLEGANGSGKTTLLNILSGCSPPDSGVIAAGSGDRRERFSFPQSAFRNIPNQGRFSPEGLAALGIVRCWQDVRLFESLTVRENISIAARGQLGEVFWNVLLRRRKVVEQDAIRTLEADRVLTSLGLEGRINARADRISLGQSKRVAIARALELKPRLLLLDEPLSGLDSEGVGHVLELISQLKTNSNVAIVIVEHALNLPVLRDLATRILSLRGGLLEELDAASNVYPESGSELLLGSLSRTCLRGWTTTRSPISGGARLTIFHSGAERRPNPVLQLKGVSIRRGHAGIPVDGKGQSIPVSFEMNCGELVVLEAPNGWGKSTLLRGIIGVLPLTAGAILLNGQNLSSIDPWRRTLLGISLLRSEAPMLGGLTVSEAFHTAGIRSIPTYLEPLSERYMSDLSGGEAQIVALETALARRRVLTMLDEPLRMLDHKAISRFLERLTPGNQEAILIAVPSRGSEETEKR